MKKDLLHTPEGVRDIYGEECLEKTRITGKLKNICEKFGYSEVQTPSFEFFDVFNSERGSVPSNELFKFFDHHGNTLVLRPDFTPSVARIAAKYFHESKLPVKVYYSGNVFINHENAYRGQLKENTTVGAELMGCGDTDEDFEIIAMTVECMKSVGLKNFQVEIGNVSFFKGLLEAAGISGEDETRLVSLINKKNYFGVEELLNELSIDESAAGALMAVPALFGNSEVLDKASSLTGNSECLDAVDRLKNLYEKLKAVGYEEYVSFDLGSLSDHRYYTGITFKAFTYGTGEAVLSGGRYDKLIGQFGTDRPSTGFAITVDKLLEAVKRQNIRQSSDDESILFVYDKDALGKAENLVFRLRGEGKRAGMIPKNDDVSKEEYLEYSKEWQFARVILLSGDKTSLLINDDATTTPIITKEL